LNIKYQRKVIVSTNTLIIYKIVINFSNYSTFGKIFVKIKNDKVLFISNVSKKIFNGLKKVCFKI